MKAKRVLFIFLLAFIHYSMAWAQTNSVLASGSWRKLAIVEEGVYKLTRADLINMSMDPSGVNPDNIRIFGTGGMLEQEIKAGIALDPVELAIEVVGGEDGSFDAGDYILFYARGSHIINTDETLKTFIKERNHYTDTAWYLLNYGSDIGNRISSRENLAGTYPIVDSYDYPVYFEQDFYNTLGSGRDWWGDKFDSSRPSKNYSWEVEDVIPGSEIKVQTGVMAYSFLPTDFDISLNGESLGTISVPDVPDPEAEDFYYDDWGVKRSSSFDVNSTIIPGPVYEIEVDFNYSAASRESEGFLDYLLLHFERQLKLSAGQIGFSSFKSLDQPISRYELESNLSEVRIWDVTLPDNPVIQNTETIASGFGWSAVSDELRAYYAFDPSDDLLKPPVSLPLDNQDIKGMPTPDLIIVTYPGFLPEAERLASFREMNDGLDVLVVTTDQIYNEFSHGATDLVAIRNMAYYFYSESSSPGKLKYLLLVGRGSYDYKNIRKGGLNYVPLYQSRESLDPLRTYSSDDFLGFLEEGEGEWDENSAGNHTMEIAVGRLPVKSQAELSGVVDKLIHYSSSTKTLGPWRKNLVFVADDGDFNLHNSQADQLSRYADTTFRRFDIKKLYLDNYVQEQRAGGKKSPQMEEQINRAIQEGSLIINYTGHGGEAGWTQEFVLDEFMITDWENIDRMPLLMTATCDFGRHDNPERISTGEKTLLYPDGGAIGLVSTSRPVFASSNFLLNRAFYEAVNSQLPGGKLNLGEIIRRTKNNSFNSVFNRNFSLLGDPSLNLAFPEYRAVVDEINEMPPDLADTIGGSGLVRLKGSIHNNLGMPVSDFNGTVTITLFDKQRTVTTLGDENTPYNYKDWNVILFSGQATVESGNFELEFSLPKNLIYSIGEGKITMYALDEQRGRDASGTDLSIKIGGESEQALLDNDPPDIELFMNDESFLDGSVVPENARLLIKLFDESGINISGLGVGQNLTAILDDEISYNLNSYYTADIDNYKSGRADFEFYNLPEGEHTIKVIAWDNQNNFAEKSIRFRVGDNEELEIFRVFGSPNPFISSTSISVEHNRPGEDIEVFLNIYDRMGKMVWTQEYLYSNSPIRIELPSWDGINAGGQKIEQGIYIVNVVLRSLKDGAKNKGYSKLINLN